ncbi:MAG: FAD-binding protein [Pirellulaceae bacterium]
MPTFTNFGGNVRFQPRTFYEPRDEGELLEILERHRDGRIRVIASRHAWSDGIVSDDVLVAMRHFNSVEIHEQDGEFSVTVGGGCQIKHLLAKLNERGLTLPSVGLITQQTIAGATATGTHGSGRHSLSHYLTSVRIACYRGEQGAAVLVDVAQGDALRAARCSLGCLGVVVSVTLPCVPQYQIIESPRPCRTVDEALSSEPDHPLQQFFLFPHQWGYCAQQRAVVDQPRSRSAAIYRLYWFLGIDIGLHLLIKLFACWLHSRTLVAALYRRLLPLMLFPRWKVVDRSDRMLVMEHELFRHLELEAFVPKERIADAARFVEAVLKQADGAPVDLPQDVDARLEAAGLRDDFAALRGVFSHHYAVCFRRVLRDDTLISMTAGDSDWWYAISFITYRRPRDDFYQMAEFLAHSLLELYGGRIHWGKWFPLDSADIERMHPRLSRFREIVGEFDPHGVFQNKFTAKILQPAATASTAKPSH